METHPAQGDVDRSIPHSDPHRSIPDYLQPYIVDQEPSRYTAIDQAVWRFVLLQLEDRLAASAHPSYAAGLAQSAISAERIPSIGEMNRALGSIGWRAVCVDGFIPPRAFQAFQSLCVLPIAAEIRSPEHLPYTPAPDIIHEAAGHAPILIDPVYAAYVRAVGEVGARAFSSPADARVDRAVRLLSELKEQSDSEARQVEAAERELTGSILALGAPSEAARISRLYWWTAEYGLVGKLADYRLYGAGLLSSLGESHFCHRPQVEKRALTADCTAVGYDITRPQPQLFIARDFEHLHSVLADVSQSLAYDIGGDYAVRMARASGELCTVYLPGGVQVIGTLLGSTADETSELLRFEANVALAQRGQLLGRIASEYCIPLGRLADMSDPRHVLGSRLAGDAQTRRVSLDYASGVRVSGLPCVEPWALSEAVLWLSDFRLELRGRTLHSSAEPYPLLLADRVVTAGAGSASREVSPLGAAPEQAGGAPCERARVPKLRALDPRFARLEHLYSLTASAERQGSRAGLDVVHAQLATSFPHDWLLRWNLLHALIGLGWADSELAAELRHRLRELEDHYAGRHPIALGIEYLRAREGAEPMARQHGS